jgi:2-dehydro-3-deoxygluconokinase
VFALNENVYEDNDVISFAVASSCLAHSIKGDVNYSTRVDVERLMNGAGTGRVIR